MTTITTREISAQFEFQFEFSICTLVTKTDEYEIMLNTFKEKGFTNENSEFLFIDNSTSNNYDGYTGLNNFLSQSKGKYIIVCHQDIRLDFDGLDELNTCINEIEKIDSNWAVLGNAGGTNNFSKFHIRITDPHGSNKRTSEFPAIVDSLDENFLVVKNDLNIGLSRNLEGFHFYGTDICLQAKFRGYNAYVIDFHLTHLSKGKLDKNFEKCKNKLIKKYELAFKAKFIQTSCTYIFLSQSSFLNFLFNNKFIFKIKRTMDNFIKI